MSYSNGMRAVLVGMLVLTSEVAWGQCPALTLTPSSLAAGQQGAAYGPVTFTATGGTTPHTFSATGLPLGVTLNATGLLSGTPSVSGTFAVRITARDARSCLGRRLLSWVINPGVAPTITSANTTGFIVGQSNTFTVTRTGTPTPTLTMGGDALPSGVTFVAATGILSGTPANGTGGTYNLVFTAANGVLPDASQNFTLTVNQRPSVSGGPFTLAENSANGATVGAVAVTDPHTPAQTHSWSITAGNTGTAFAIDSSGVLTVATSSAVDFETTPIFTLTVQATDNGTPVLSGSATITINLSNVNEGPTAVADSATVAEGGTVTTLSTPAGATSVRDNDSDPDDALAALAVTLSSAPTNASAFTLNTDGTFSYTHNGSETTADSFIYQLCDPAPVPLCDTATVFITITAGNDAPVLTAGATLAYTENQAATAIDATLTVVDTDDVNLESATVQLTDNYQNGEDVLACGACGTLSASFVAATGTLTLSGSDTLANYEVALRSVTYENTSQSPNTVTRTVTWIGNDGTTPSVGVTSTITVATANDPPVLDLDANDDQGTTGSNFAATFLEGSPPLLIEDPTDATLADVDHATLATVTVRLTNLLDAGQEVLAVAAATISPNTPITATYDPTTVPTEGVLTLSGAGTVAQYQAALRTITYRNTSNMLTTTNRVVTFVANDGSANSNIATATVSITAVDDNPTAVNDAATVIEDAPATAVAVLANDIDPDAGPKSIQSVTQPANGAVVITGGGTGLTYQPNANYCNNPPGTTLETFTYTITPGNTTATVTVTVTCVDDPPVAVNDSATVSEDSGANAVAVLSNDTDVDGGPISVASVTQPANGAVVITGGGTGLTYQPNANYCNNPPGTTPSTFTYTLTPGSSTATVSVTVTCVNDPPLVTAPGPFTVTGNVAISLPAPGLLTTVSDPVDGGAAAPFTMNSASFTSTQGGAISVNTGTGAFTYNPPAGYTGADSFTYQVCDSGVPGSACTAATVNLTINDMIWFIDNTAAVGDGRLSSPFNTLSAFQAVNDGTGNNPAAGDNIFLYESATAYSGPVTLLNNQKLIGQDATASLATVAGITLAPNSAALPVMDSANGTIVNLTSTTDAIRISTGASNTVRGLTVGNVTNTGTSINMNTGATTFGTLTVTDVGINTNGRALSLQGGIFNATLTGLTSSAGTNNVNLLTIGGTANLGSGALSGATGTAFNVNGGTATVTYSGTITQASAGQRLLDVTNHSTGTLTLSGALNATNGTGLGFSNVDGVYTLSGVVTLNGGDAGIDVSTGSAGLITLANTSSVITNPSGVAVDIDSSSAGFTLSFAGNITKTNNATTAIDLTNNTSGTISFTGTSKTLSTTTASAVNLATNTGSTINFSNGGLVITTTSGAGFTATGGAAAINITGTGNTISSGAGTALNVNNSTIGGSGLTFQSISANGAANGIVLNTTGALGGLTVTGTGAAGSGGTIQSSTGPGVLLTSTRTVNLTSMNITSGADDGIRGSTVTGLSLTGVQVMANGNAVTEAGIDLTNLFGTSTWSGTTISSSAEDNVVIRNSSGTLTSLTVTSSTFSNNSSIGNDGFLMEASGTASMTASLTGNTFTAHRGDHFQAAGVNSGILDVVFSNNTLSGGHATALGQGITINAATGVPGYSGTVDYNIDNNTINGSILSAITANLGTSANTANMRGTISGNTIGTVGSFQSGSTQASGITVEAHGNGTHTTSITNNTIRQTFDRGINTLANDGNGTFNMTVTGNNSSHSDGTNSREGFFLNNGSADPNIFGVADSHFVCLSLGGVGALKNTLTHGPGAPDDFRMRQRFNSTIRLPGYGGTTTDTTAVVTFVNGNNTSATGSATVNSPPGGGFVGGAACPTPP